MLGVHSAVHTHSIPLSCGSNIQVKLVVVYVLDVTLSVCSDCRLPQSIETTDTAGFPPLTKQLMLSSFPTIRSDIESVITGFVDGGTAQ